MGTRKGFLMKKALILLAFINTGALAQTQYFYGPNGQYQGQAMQSGNNQFFYGANGQYQGQAMQSGNSTYFYGPQGQSQGQTINQSTPIPMMIAPSYNQPTNQTPLFFR
jgi:hypothetical protein